MSTYDVFAMTAIIQETEDHDLLSQVAAGSSQAFEALYTRYAPRIRAYLRRQLHALDCLDEALNDVMIVIWQKAEHCPPHVALLAWLYGIARNTARAYLRGAMNRSASAPPELVSEEDPEASILAQERARVLAQAIAALPCHERQPVELFIYHKCSYQDIAGQLNININTVKTRVARARLRLEAALSN